jgi:hypothetical protein
VNITAAKFLAYKTRNFVYCSGEEEICQEFSAPPACARGREILGLLAALTHYYVFHVVCGRIVHLNYLVFGSISARLHSAAEQMSTKVTCGTPPFS